MSIKKIIAREGLVFLGVILIALIIVFVSSVYSPRLRVLNNKDNQIQSKVSEGKGSLTEEEWLELKSLEEEKMESKNNDNEWVDVDDSNQYPADIATKIKEMKPLTDADVSVIEKINLVNSIQQRREEIKWNGLMILLIAYVLYLIPIRFSLWAIRTLRSK